MASRVIATEHGRASLDALTRLVTELKADDPMAPVTVLVPHNVAGIVARRHLAAATALPSGVAGLHLATLPRLAERLAAARLAPRRPATGPVVASAWRSALEADPGVFAAVVDHPATIRALARAHRELRDLSSQALDAVAGAGRLAGDVVRLHRDVTERLRTRWYDVTDLLTAAAAQLMSRPEEIHEQGALVLYLPQDLTQAEAGFGRALSDAAEAADSSGLTVVAAATGVQRADAAVVRSLQRLGLDLPRDTGIAPRRGHRVLHASDSDDEVRCVVREVVAALSTTPAHRVAVLYGSSAPYARILHEQLTAAGIAYNGPGARAVHERSLARGFLGILGLASSDLPRAGLFVALADAPARAFDGARVPVSRWERLSRSAGVVGGHQWAPRLRALIEGEERTIASEQGRVEPTPGRIEASRRAVATAEELLTFVSTLRDRLAEGSALGSWSNLSRWSLRLFSDLYGEGRDLARLPPDEQYAAATIEATLRGLGGLDELEPVADLGRLTEVLALELEQALPRVGRFGEGVFVGPVSAAVGLDVDLVYIVGLAEDAFPGRLHEDALLPARVRELSLGELVAPREIVDARHRHLLAALSAAPMAVACFPRGDLRRSTRRLPSRFLLHTLRDLSGNQDLAATDWDTATSAELSGSPSYAASLAANTRPATEQEWRVLAQLSGLPTTDPAVVAGLALLRARSGRRFTRYDGNLSGAEGLPDYAAGERRVSPTALETFATCPHAYFVERLLRVRPLEQPEEVVTISPLDVGNLVHESFDELVQECGDDLPAYGRPWTKAQRRRLRAIASEKARTFEQRGLTGHRLLWERELALILADIDAMLDDDDAWRAGRDAKVVASELTFGTDGRPAVTVPVDCGAVQMLGSADKVDETRDGVLLVTDIKTGGTSRFKDITADPVVGGTKLQLPVYAYAARQLLGGDDNRPVEAQYWFVRKQRGERISITLDDALAALYSRTLGTLVAAIVAGQFPAKAPDQADFAWVQCPYCNPDGLGHGDVRERWERQRHDPVLAALVSLIDPDALLDAGAGHD